MKLRINVTKETIWQTKHCQSVDADMNCAIAHEILQVFPMARVMNSHIKWYHPDLPAIKTQLPPSARSFIADFDKYNHHTRPLMLEPISFDIDVPEEIINMIDITEISKCQNLELV